MTIPVKPIFLLADSRLLFEKGGPKSLLERVKELLDCETPKTAYIGASNGDDPVFFSLFETAMSSIDIRDNRMIYSDYSDADQTRLKEADLILLAGGDATKGWSVLESTGMIQDIIQRYYAGAILMGVSAGAVHLGLAGSPEEPSSAGEFFDTMKLVPFLVAAHDEARDWAPLKLGLSTRETYIKGLGIPAGGGFIYHPDHTVEPLGQALIEVSREKDENQFVQNLLMPPLPETESPEDKAPASAST